MSGYPWPSHENDRIEFKAEWTDTAKKTMIAFANTFGGHIYFGVDDAGLPIGINNYDALERSILNFARSGVEPNMSSLVHIKIITIEGNEICQVTINPGDDRPYSFKGKSWTNGGVFVRVGSSSMQANRAEIMQMARDITPWEERISSNQELTFSSAISICKAKNLDFKPVNYVGYGITDTTGRFTNLGLLLSDQNPETFNINHFLNEGGRFSGGTTLSGSLLQIREDALRIISNENIPYSQKNASAQEREDSFPWPPIAIRESLTNCIAHRDFETGISCPSTVNFFADRLVFQTVSSLPFNISMTDLFEDGFSFCRNAKLTDFFKRLHWMEKVGSGFTDIFASYADSNLTPSCTCSGRIFKIVLPKFLIQQSLEEEIRTLLRQHRALTRKEIEALTKSPRSTVSKALLDLQKDQIITRIGAGRACHYELRLGA